MATDITKLIITDVIEMNFFFEYQGIKTSK